jgi:hypothetical protein
LTGGPEGVERDTLNFDDDWLFLRQRMRVGVEEIIIDLHRRPIERLGGMEVAIHAEVVMPHRCHGEVFEFFVVGKTAEIGQAPEAFGP